MSRITFGQKQLPQSRTLPTASEVSTKSPQPLIYSGPPRLVKKGKDGVLPQHSDLEHLSQMMHVETGLPKKASVPDDDILTQLMEEVYRRTH